MTDEKPGSPGTTPEPAEVDDAAATDATGPTEPEWQRRRRLAAVFGDVLPETTSDERDQDAGDGEAADERWWRAQVPPHHG